MKTWLWAMALLATLAMGAVASEQDRAETGADAAEASALLKAAKAEGVSLEATFEMSPVREAKVLKLIESGSAGSMCQITCPGPKVGAIACPVGKMCQCSCAGGGPDCTCRYSGT